MIKINHNQIKILDENSLKIGSIIEIPHKAGDWFDNQLIGKNKVVDFGYTYSLEELIQDGENSIEELCFWVEFEFPENAPEENILTSNLISVNHLAESYTSYSVITGSAKSYNENRDIYIHPMQNRSIGLSQGTKIKSLSKLPFRPTLNRGVDGYSTIGGLIQTAHKHIEGDFFNEGWVAAGSQVEILAPVPTFIDLNIRLELENTVSRNTIESVVKTSLVSYIKDLDISKNIYISALTSVCQSVTGVKSVEITSDRTPISGGVIILSEKSKAVLRINDINIII